MRVTQGHRECHRLIQQVRLPLYAYSLPSLATTSSVEFCLQFSDDFVNIHTQIFCVSEGATETWEDEKTAIITMISAHRKITGFTDQRQRPAVTTTTSGATWRMKLQRQLRFLVTCSSSRIMSAITGRRTDKGARPNYTSHITFHFYKFLSLR